MSTDDLQMNSHRLARRCGGTSREADLSSAGNQEQAQSFRRCALPLCGATTASSPELCNAKSAANREASTRLIGRIIEAARARFQFASDSHCSQRLARVEQREIRDRPRGSPDFVSLNPGYACRKKEESGS